MNPIIIPKRALISDTKYSTNIGTVVSNGAKRMQRTSAATEIFASLYSLRPNSSSLMNVFYEFKHIITTLEATTYFEPPANEAVVYSEKGIPSPALKTIPFSML